MKSFKRGILYGFLLWLVPFLVSFAIFPLRTSNRILFETLMPVVLAVTASAFAVLYFRKVKATFLEEGVRLGILWLAISLLIDLFMFSWGPMAMGIGDYMMDIGLTYLIFPAVTVGIGWALRHRS